MQQLLLTLDTPAANVALDEALLEAAEAGELADEVLRIWEPAEYAVVLGRSSQADTEVNLPACRAQGVPVLRRASGGGVVLVGPGCLMVSLVLSLQRLPQLRAVDHAHRWVLETMASALAPQVSGIQRAGISDLALPSGPAGALCKCSGNSVRLRRSHLLYHGTLLYDFDLPRIGQLLGKATRQPEYRCDRTHGDFVANLPLSRDELATILIHGWHANASLKRWPEARLTELLTTRYAADSLWIL